LHFVHLDPIDQHFGNCFPGIGQDAIEPLRALVRWHHTRTIADYSIATDAHVLLVCEKRVQVATLPSKEFIRVGEWAPSAVISPDPYIIH
jgi:hypothetical protein